jgi:hypothetical protein
VRARERALDEALRQAVGLATTTLLDPDQLVARSSDLQLRIYPKARSYVPNYRVLEEGEQPPGVFEIRVSAQVTTSRLLADLTGPSATGATPRPSSGGAACTLTCLSPKGPEAERLAARLGPVQGVGGAATVAYAGSCSVDALVRELRARACDGGLYGVVEVAAVTDEQARVRGTDRLWADARATLKLLDGGGRVVGDASGAGDAYDATRDGAATRAVHEAVAEAAQKLGPVLAQRSAAEQPSGVVAVRLSGIAGYSEYQEVARALAGVPGVSGVEPRRFHDGVVELWVHTSTRAGQLAALLSRLPVGGRVAARPLGDRELSVEVQR